MFRFTIRELLLVIVIVGLVVGWWVDRQRLCQAALDSRHGQAVAERHLDEYRRAYIELHRAVEREGFAITSSNGTTHVVDSKQAGKTIPSGEVVPAPSGEVVPARPSAGHSGNR